MAGSSAMSTPPREEFVIRVPEVLPDQMVSVFKFGANMRVDVTQWNQVTMDREDNADVYAEEDAMPRYGAGSEFGRQARMEARRKKLGYRDRQYRRSDQPWLLTQNDRPTVRKFRGIREGGVSEHADYWLFVKSGDNVFNAYPVNEWYNFMAVSRYKTLDIDEAEEQFKMRTKVLNQFALKSQLKATAAAAATADSAAEEPSGSTDAADGRSDNSTEAIRKAAMKKRKEERKMAKKRGSDQDLIASEESDDGDEEGREIDYMSDTESDESESDPGKREAPQLIGVDEEVGMRNFIASDNEEEEEETDADIRKDLNNMATYPTTATFGGDEEQDSDSDSDSDDPDSNAIKSAFLLQKKKECVTTTGPTAEAAPKRPAKDEDAQEGSSSSLPAEKKAKMEVDIREEITEAEVLRYLQRKPLTCQDLVSKFRSRCSRMPKQQIVQRMAHILRKLKPVQVRRNNALYFSLPGRRN